MKIGTTIKKFRKERGFNAGQFAKQIEISATSLSFIESNKKYPHQSTMDKICEVLDVSEPAIMLLSLEEADVPKHKKAIFREMYPLLEPLIRKILIK